MPSAFEEREPRRVGEVGGAPETGRAAAPGSPEDALRRLEQRLDQATAAAERLMAQAAAQAARAAGASAAGERATGESGPRAGDPATPPPAGWQASDDDGRASTSELDPLVALIQAMRDLIPPDLQRRLIAALREVLLALRALIDWYLERLDRGRDQGVEVQDIPIL